MNITINNSLSQIIGWDSLTQQGLTQLLSYKIDSNAAFFSQSWKTTRPLISKKGVFPTGLLLQAQSYLKKHGIKYTICDLRRLPASRSRLFTLARGRVPYDDQKLIVEACRRLKRGTVSSPTGTGKSYTMALLIEALQLKTLIVVPNLTLKAQLQADFKQSFGSLKNITIENIDSPVLKHASDYDVLIIDEAHHVAAKTYRKLNAKVWGGIYYRFFFTATPFRSREEEQILFESIAGQVVYRLNYKTAVDKGYIVPVEAYYIELPKTPNDCDTWQEAYRQLVVNNPVRNGTIASLLGKLQDNQLSALCLVKEIAHGNNLALRTGVKFANGESEYCRELILEFALDERKCLIGTNGVLGEGVDTKPCEYVVIAGLGKSKNAFMQQVGRGVRRYKDKESCKVIIFKDPSNKYTLRHFKEQCKILRQEYGVTPIKL